MKKTIFICAIFMLLLGMEFAGLSITNYTVSKSTFQPNEPGVITATVVNPSGTESVSAIAMSVSTPYEISLTGSSKLSDIQGGGTAIVSIPIEIKQDASAGVYLVTITFTGTAYDIGDQPETVISSVSVPITVLSSPIFSFTTDTTSIGSIDAITLNISNNGGIAKNARLSTSGAISLYGTNEIFIGNIDDTEQVVLNLDSRSASEGQQNLTLVMNYEDELGTEHSDTYVIRMTVKQENLDITFSQNSELVTREESVVLLGLTNTGNKQLTDVRLSFDNSSVRLKDSNQLLFGDISPGSTEEVSATMSADLTPGLNMIEGTLTWVEEDVTREETISFPLTISSDADVAVYLEAKPTPLYAGQEHTISVLVSNLGSYAIDNVDVEFNSDSLQSIDISDSQYIGSLNNDDFSTVQFKVRVDTVPEGEYPITLTINYRDKSGEWQSKTITEYVNIYTQPVSDGSGFFMLGAVVVLAALGWFFFIRKKPAKVG